MSNSKLEFGCWQQGYDDAHWHCPWSLGQTLRYFTFAIRMTLEQQAANKKQQRKVIEQIDVKASGWET